MTDRPALSLPRRALPLAVGMFLGATPGGARPLMPGEWERWWDDMLRAPIHLQAEMIARPAIGFGARTRAVGEAVVRHVFRGGELLPVGQRFRFSVVPGTGDWFIRPGAPVMPVPSDPPVFVVPRDDLQIGRLAELFLDVAPYGPSDAFSVVTDGFRTIDAVGDPPRLDPRDRPPRYDQQYFQGDPLPAPALRRVPSPHPDFPRRDVVLDYATHRGTQRQDARAAYHAGSRRLRVTPLDSRAAARGDLLLDGFAQVTTRLWERDQTFSVRPGRSGERYGHAIGDGQAQRVGAATVAGVPCTEWRIRYGTREARSWITADGVQLRRVEPGLTMEVSHIVFRALPVDRFVVPGDWRRVPEDADAADCTLGAC